MPTNNYNPDNENLLSQIEKMLSKKGRSLIYKNSLLGFCAQLITTKPRAKKEFGQKLFKKLQKEQFALSQKTSSTKEALFRIKQELSFKPWILKAVPLLASLLLLISLASSDNLKESWASLLNGQLKPSAKILQKDNALLESGSNLLEVAELKKQKNYKVLKEHNGFQLIEYILLDGSKMIVVESILF